MVYLRDHFICQECGVTKKALDIHHKIPFLDVGSNSLDNLTTLAIGSICFGVGTITLITDNFSKWQQEEYYSQEDEREVFE